MCVSVAVVVVVVVVVGGRGEDRDTLFHPKFMLQYCTQSHNSNRTLTPHHFMRERERERERVRRERKREKDFVWLCTIMNRTTTTVLLVRSQ